MDKPLLDWNYLKTAFLIKSNKNKVVIDGLSKPDVVVDKSKETAAIRVRKMFAKSKHNV